MLQKFKKVINLIAFLLLFFFINLFILPQNVNAGCSTDSGTNPNCQSGCRSDGPYCIITITCLANNGIIASRCCDLVNGLNCGSACFPAGTKISLPNKSVKNIEDIKVGDKVLSDDGTGKQSISTVTQTQNPISNNICQINFTNNDILRVTQGHPLFTPNGWASIDPVQTEVEDPGFSVTKLISGNFMKKDTGEWVQIRDISCKNEATQTYNFTAEPNNTYYADDYLAHNKCKCGGGWDPWGCSKGCPQACQHGSFCGYSKKPPIVAKYDCRCYHCDACPTCNANPPTNATITRNAPNSATISWTPATTNIFTQKVQVDTDKAAVTGNCSAGCLVNAELIPTETSYTFPVKPGFIYYWRVLTYNNAYGGCNAPTAVSTFLSACSLVSSAGNTLSIGGTTTLSTAVFSNAAITSVGYTLSASANGVFTVNPATDTTYPYSTLGTAIGTGGVTVTNTVYSGATNLCSSSLPIQILAKEAWWQIKDADVQTNGDLVSPVVFGNFFGLAGPGGYSGVPTYGGSLGGIDSTNVSETSQKWIANATAASPKTFDYQFFANQIPSNVTINTINIGDDISAKLTDPAATADSEGYYWYKYNGGDTNVPATISATDLTNRKVILFVQNGDANITGNINLTDGQGFFILITDGNVNVDPSVGGGATPNLKGFYVMDGNFVDGTLNPGDVDPATSPDTELWVRGSVIVNGSATLERDLGPTGNTSSPGELFNYAPEQLMLFPKALSVHPIDWKEIAP